MNHALTMTYVAKPLLNPIIVFRMVKMTLQHGLCNIVSCNMCPIAFESHMLNRNNNVFTVLQSAFAFSCYGGWLVTEPTCDVEGGHRMGRVATEMMNR